ncbi:type IV pilus inner membrane component PilO [Microbulbifer thermotolerans]|uniref:Pilus assembly protein PilP n=1 Tax=Microbulbifer thermotolerans TaxID=252514 RepID=A0A143HIM3_MICTH|nr:type 4a pilus biogenesis protein PilO [Microbulbifer thermotolerans]AMX01357.1 pilus assembly protein PilP [Microbulbifer thermotolerans]MCX2780298.1 type 4a pilus biogenesis protein PilO [Microbulbifer thermotolerans]MCX2782761.1 type 4a pilus biogenesis protein PilO [Microbulbifer thermotolerans]MCX2795516.1 type 4a pilus biogenesis protein PilO [Microbulbifer thermotolerans]MCX2800229.1 type 4a pilus biogenesis protein PilO [Microbulbifer thermotolerans]
MALEDTLKKLNELDINDIDFSRVGVWPLAGRVALLIVIAAVLIAGGYYVLISDRYQQLELAANKEQELFTQFERKSFEAANLDAYREQLAEMEDIFGALLKQLPKDTEVPGLLEDIDEYGRGSGLTIKKVQLENEQVGEFYVELPIRIEVEGGYHEFGAFVSGIAGMPRIVTLHDFDIKTSKDSGALLSMVINAKTYRYKDQGEEG